MAWTEVNVIAGQPTRAIELNSVQANFEAMAKRESNAPIVQIPVKVYLFGSGTWTIPDNVTAFEACVTGPGGAAGGGGTAPASTVIYDGLTVTGGGGGNGGTSSSNGAGGVASGGDLNIDGSSRKQSAAAGFQSIGGSSIYGGPNNSQFPSVSTYGAGSTAASAGDEAGGGGATAIKRFIVNSAVPDVTYNAPAGGTGAGDGVIVITY